MTHRLLLVMPLAALAVACGGGAVPCTECPNVAGSYSLTAEPVQGDPNPGADPCEYIYFSGANSFADVGQNGSALVFSSGILDANGTLYEGMQVGFDPVYWDLPDIGDVQVLFSGTFYGPEGSRELNGNLSFTIPDGGNCQLRSAIHMAQLSG